MAIQREQVVQTAEKYVSRGKIEPAIREYRKLLADNPNDINTLNRIGDLYARIQRIDEAVDFFTQIAEQYSTEGFFVKAIAIYKKIIKLDPTRLEVYEKLAELYHKQGLVNEARTQYQVLADYYQKHDNAASAIAIYQKMADLEPNNPSYHVKLAEIYQRQQLIEKAMSEYRVIAEMMLAHDRSQDAAQVYERALDIDSTNVGFIQDALTRLRASGNTAAAARFLSIAAERNPQAGRLAQLTRMDEPLAEVAQAAPAAPVVEARAEPPRPVPPLRPEAPPVVTRAPEQRYVPPPPLPVAEPLGEEPQIYGGAFPEIEIEEEDDLAATMQAAAAALVPGPAAFPFDEPAAAQAIHEEEIDLDLDEVFVLDMDSDDEPASLVKPPPDLATDGGLRLGSAWSAPAGKDAAAAVREEPEVEEKIEQGFEGLPEMDFELELEPEAEPLASVASEVASPPSEPAAPAADLGQFDSLPSLGGEFVFELDEDLPPLEGPTWTVEPEPRYEPETLRIDADLLERTAAELQPRAAERDEDLVSEAEVLAKYGLEEKALERLRDALKIRPQNLGAYALMIQIHLEKGHHDRVVELARAMSRIAVETGDSYLWPKSRRHLVDAGYRLDGDRVQAGPHGIMEEMAPAPKPVPPPPQAVAPAPAPPTPEPPTPGIPPAPAAAPPPVARKKPAGNIDQMLQSMLDAPKRPRPAAPPAAPIPAAPAPEPPPVVAAPAPVEPPPPMASAPPPPPMSPSPMQVPPSSAPRPGLFNPLEIGEMIEREEMDWDDEPEPSGPSPFQSIQPPAPPPGVSGGLQPGLDDTGGMSWLDEADKRRPGKEGRSERLFDEEEDFFDLAGELEQELSQEDGFPPGDGLLGQQAEQSLEEIVEGFKKGVAEHLSPTDYDTHFNLGIAYREMGLLDEAIGEFQIAAKEPSHMVLCCSMLGLCFLDKGLPELAVRWYRRGLETPGLGEEDNLGLHYDLGCAYLGLDDKESAYKVFVDLYGMDTNYRDVVARIEELGPR
jgi:pilus assembly protein FimV